MERRAMIPDSIDRAFLKHLVAAPAVLTSDAVQIRLTKKYSQVEKIAINDSEFTRVVLDNKKSIKGSHDSFMRDSLQVAVETESQIPLAPVPYSTLYWPQPQIEVPLVVKVLLDELTSQWDSLSLVVEEAAKRGLRVVCITGSRPQEGRSTVAKALAIRLACRGNTVSLLEGVPRQKFLQNINEDVPKTVMHGSGGTLTSYQILTERSSDRTIKNEQLIRKLRTSCEIVIVDDSSWFSAIPVRLLALESHAMQCDAVILVRRADRERIEPHDLALNRLGLECLSEVITFVQRTVLQYAGSESICSAQSGSHPPAISQGVT